MSVAALGHTKQTCSKYIDEYYLNVWNYIKIIIFTAPVKLSALEKLFYLSIQNLNTIYIFFVLLFITSHFVRYCRSTSASGCQM